MVERPRPAGVDLIMSESIENNAAYSHRAIWAIALPMMLSAVSTPLVGFVDTGVMGHLDSPLYLAAVAANATIFSVVLMGLNFLRMGTTGVTAQAYGAANYGRTSESLVQGIVIATVLAGVLLVMQIPIRETALRIIQPDAATTDLARAYFDIRIWSSPATLWNFVLIGWLLGMQNARGPLMIMLSINLTNATLDLLLVVGMGMTVDGVALATVLAEFAGLLTGLYFVRREMTGHDPLWKPAHYRDWSRYRQLFAINGNLFIRSLALMLTLAFITAQGARLGAVVLASNALLMNFIYFMAYALDGIAHAAEALAGKAYGARTRGGLELAVNRTLAWTGLFAILFSLFYLVAGNTIIATLSDIPEIRQTAAEYLPWLIAAPLISAWCFLYDGVYVGITRAREMRVVMVGATLLVFLPTWFICRSWGNHALWFALLMFMAARGVGMHIWYRRLLVTGRLHH